MAKGNRFSALRQLRDQRQEGDEQDSAPQEQGEAPITDQETSENPPEPEVNLPSPDTASAPEKNAQSDSQQPSAAAKPKKRGPGRPPGRRSNPDYTQISAYIPLELLLEVQDELAEERREKKQRTPRPVSDLMEELLASWLKKRKRKNSSS